MNDLSQRDRWFQKAYAINALNHVDQLTAEAVPLPAAGNGAVSRGRRAGFQHATGG
jgi:hypothetical protein